MSGPTRSALDAEYMMRRRLLDHVNEKRKAKALELKQCKAKIEDATRRGADLHGRQKRTHDDCVLAPLRAMRSRLGQQMADAQQEAAELSLSIGEARARLGSVAGAVENHFVKIAHKTLPPDTFKDIMDRAVLAHREASSATHVTRDSGSALPPVAGVAGFRVRSGESDSATQESS